MCYPKGQKCWKQKLTVTVERVSGEQLPLKVFWVKMKSRKPPHTLNPKLWGSSAWFVSCLQTFTNSAGCSVMLMNVLSAQVENVDDEQLTFNLSYEIKLGPDDD